MLNGAGGSDTLLGNANDDVLYGDGADTPAETMGDDYTERRYTMFNTKELYKRHMLRAVIRESSNQSAWEVAA